jgi:hypothetical protein
MSAHNGRKKLKRIADQLSNCALIGLNRRFLINSLTSIHNASITKPTQISKLAQIAFAVKASRGERFTGGIQCIDKDIELFKRKYEVQDDSAHARNRIREVRQQLIEQPNVKSLLLNEWLPQALHLIAKGALPSKVLGLHGKQGHWSSNAGIHAQRNLEALYRGWIAIATTDKPEGLGMKVDYAVWFLSDALKNNYIEHNTKQNFYRAESSLRRIWSNRQKDRLYGEFRLFSSSENIGK